MTSTKCKPILQEMPDHIKQRIVGKLDPWTQRSIRQCSKEFLFFSDQLPLQYYQLLIQLKDISVEVSLYLENDPKGLSLVFEAIDSESCRVMNNNERWQKEDGQHFVMAAGEHIFRILKNPRVSLEKLTFDMDGYRVYDRRSFRVLRYMFMKYLDELLEPEDRKIPVKLLCMRMEDEPEDVVSILAHLETGTLSRIELIGKARENDSDEDSDEDSDSDEDEGDKRLDMNLIVALEQFKRAKSLYSRNLYLKCYYEDVECYDEVMKVMIPRLTLEIVKKVLESFKTQPTRHTVMLNYEAIDEADVDGYLAQFELEDGWNRVANILPTSPEQYLTIDLYKDRFEFDVLKATRN